MTSRCKTRGADRIRRRRANRRRARNRGPIKISFLETAGSVCGSLLPTGALIDTFDEVEVTCIDNGMPVVVMAAEAFCVSGYETRDELNANDGLKKRVESIRLQAGPAMNLGDVAKKVVPKCAWSRNLPPVGTSQRELSSHTIAMPQLACWAPSPWLPPRSCQVA